MSRRILVVEDQVDNQQILRDLLTSVGYEVIEAENARRIKADPALRTIPVIVVTSYALSGDEAKARDAGCDAYVTKPFSPRALLAKIREYVP
jgi:two-component system cell cycle response regulator DivK